MVKLCFISIIFLCISMCSTVTLRKCCPTEHNVEKDYGYKSPEQFFADNLHCRHNPESLEHWIPKYLNLSYNEIDVPESSQSSMLSTCIGYDIKKYIIDPAEFFSCSESGDLNFYDSESGATVNLSGDSYCIDNDFYDNSPVIMTCSCPNGNCVQYCCQNYGLVGVIDDAHNLQCVNSNLGFDDWNLNEIATNNAPNLLWVERSTGSLSRECNYASLNFNKHNQYDLDGLPTDSKRSVYVLKYRPVMRADEFFIDKNAVLHANGKFVSSYFYCVAPTLNASKTGIVTAAFYCSEHHVFRPSAGDIIIQSWFAGAGAVFSLLTVLGLALSPHLRKGPEGVILFTYCLSMLCGYVAMSVKPYNWTVKGTKCVQLAHVLQFFFLSAFFWLNVRAVIIFTRFRSLETMLTRMSGKQRAPWLLPLCALYALGVPAIVCGITAFAQQYSHHEHRAIWYDGHIISDHTHEYEKPSWLITPDLDDTTCWFGTALGRAMYYTLPMGLGLFVNLGMFISTVTRLVALTKRGSVKSTDDFRSDKRRLVFFVKMFVVMGLSWSGEFLSFANYLSHYYWYLATCNLTVRAAAVFVIFCCRRKVWNDLRKLCCKKRVDQEEEQKDPEMTTKAVEMSHTTSTQNLTRNFPAK